MDLILTLIWISTRCVANGGTSRVKPHNWHAVQFLPFSLPSQLFDTMVNIFGIPWVNMPIGFVANFLRTWIYIIALTRCQWNEYYMTKIFCCKSQGGRHVLSFQLIHDHQEEFWALFINSKVIHNKVSDEVIYTFPILNGAAVDVSKWVVNFKP